MERTKQKSWKAIVVGFVAVTLGGFRSTAWSEDAAPPPSSQTLEQRLSILERKLEITEEAASPKAKEAITPKTSGTDGFQLQNADKSFVLKIRGLLQTDSRQYVSDQAGNQTSQFLVRRARPILEGTLYNTFSFLITPDFASNGRTTLYDAYLDIAPWTFAKLRVGKFKPPIGLEHLQADPNVIFAERGLPSNLTPNRDTGVQLFGDVASGALSYAAAFTNGAGDNNTNTTTATPVTSDTDNNDAKEGTARIVVKPFKNTTLGLVQSLGLGLGASYARQSIVNPNYSSPGQISLFTPAAAATPDGEKIRIAPEASWYYHAFGIYGEYIQASQVYRVSDQRFRVINNAWQAAVSYVLTGEDASFTGVKPRKPFDVKNGTWGAWELAGRYGQLCLDPDNFTRGVTTNATAAQRTQSYGLGVNWYLNQNIRFSTSYDQTTFDKGATVGDRPNEKTVISRWQLSF